MGRDQNEGYACMCDDRSTTRTTFGLLLAAIKVAHFDREVQLLAALQSNKCNTGSIEGTGSSGREEAPAKLDTPWPCRRLESKLARYTRRAQTLFQTKE